VALAVGAVCSLAGCGGVFAKTSTNSTTTLATLPATTTTAAPVATTLPTPTEYEIARGDTMRKIAAKFNTSVEAILAANPKVTDPNKIQAGQRIIIPPPTAPPVTAPGITTVAPAPPST
jgi:LysM repeat protein